MAMTPSGELDAAARAAAEAFRDYSRRSGRERAQLLRGIAAGLEALGDTLIECVHRETALPAARVANERARTCMQLRLFADVAEEGGWVDERVDPADPHRQPPRPRVRSLLRPVGPVAVFGASNFPLAFSVAGGDTAAALAVGCPVIVKAHPAHPDTSAMVARVIDAAVAECGLPRGVFSLLYDTEHPVGMDLVQHPLVKAGAFTGSARGGLALLHAAQARPEPIPFFAEMGSVNPVFILPGALATQSDAIAAGLQASMTLGVGQFCTQPGLCFLLDDVVGNAFLGKLAALVAATPAGVMLTPSMDAAYRRAVAERGTLRGLRMLASVAALAGDLQAGAALFVADAATFLANPTLTEEVFGPASLAVLCKTLADYERCAEHLPGQLTATVWGQAHELAAQATCCGPSSRGLAESSPMVFRPASRWEPL
jgi:alpha-ketoglutaric semialdehyde dehydrogenase